MKPDNKTPKALHTGQKRYDEMRHAFGEIMFGPAADDWRARESEILPEIALVFPGASEVMLRASARLTMGFVRDMPGLLGLAVPGHMNMLSHYAWGRPTSADEAEGHGPFWLYHASNEITDRFETTAIPSLAGAFLPNALRPMAVRSWIRLQSVYFDPFEAGRLHSLWNDHFIGGGDVFAVPARRFVRAIEVAA